MARVAIQDEDWVNAIAYAEKARKLVRDLESERGIKLPAVQLSLDGQLGVALVPYYPPKHHERAARLLNGVLDAHPDDYAARFAVGEIAETAGEWAGARAHFQRLLDAGSADEREIVAAREEVGWCLVNEGDLEAGRDVLESVVELRDSHKEAAEAAATAAHKEFKDDEAFARARAWWRLGRTEWELGGAEARAHAEEWFMASLRADATFAPAYTALGICYAEQRPPDAERALKCFQKAFELDATEADAARRLAYGYAAEDEWAQVRAIATRVMEGEGGVEGVAAGAVKPEPGSGRFAPKNAWAWKALGSTEMYYKNYTKALSAYQIALRATPDDADMWRMLGDAYAKSGRHMAALKALQHALDLDPDMWLARYTVGEVYLQLGEHVRAIEAFTEIDESVGGTEAGVTAALAEAALALGRHAASGGFVARARSAFTDAIKHAARVLRARAHRAWGWKLVGDCTLLLAEYEREADGEAEGNEEADALRPVLELLVADDDDRRSAVAGLGHASNLLQQPTGTPHTTLKAAVFAYAYRAHLLKNEPRVADAALYDLACGLHALSLRSEEDRAAATKAAVAAVRLALEREPGDERLWNALAVVAASAPQLAQHALVVALECYPKDTAVWTNLGYLYLQLDERELANACLLRAQTLDPDHARAWFGQAVLAQRDGQEEAAGNLFAHAATLAGGALLEADLALAVAAFARSTATAANGGDAAAVLHEPAFALKRYVGACPRDAAAQHLYGLVCERLGLADAAVSALAAAVVRFEDEYEATESSDVEASYLVAVANLARARLGSGEYAAALEAYASFEELAAGSSDVRVAALAAQAHLGSALAHFHTGDLDASLASFQSALDASKNDPSASDEITVLLARTLWGVGGTDARDAAKTQLLGALEGNPGVRVIAALGAAGLGSGDADLVDAAVAELSGVPPSRRAAEDPAGGAALVQYASALVSGDQAAAVSALEAAAASDARPAPRNALAAAYIAAGKPEAADTLLAGAGADADAARLRGEALVLSGDDAGIAYLQRAVRLRPWDDSAWEALAWARRAVAELEE
jgi:superkiller protein 3